MSPELRIRETEPLIYSTFPKPVVCAGLWGNPEHHRYTMLRDVFAMMGVEGSVIGAGRNIVSWDDFVSNVDTGIQNATNASGEKILIGSSAGALFLLRYLTLHPETPFSKVFLLGFSPNPGSRSDNMPQAQIDVWKQVGIQDEVIAAVLNGFKQEWRQDIMHGIEKYAQDERFVFIHGTEDETIPVQELIALNPVNLHIIPGLEHNSAKNLEQVLRVIWNESVNVDFHPVLKMSDLLNFPTKGEPIGLVPFFSGNRVGWACLFGQDINLVPMHTSRIFIGAEEGLPGGYHKTAAFGETVYGVSIRNLREEGYQFYSPLVPQMSHYPSRSWVLTAFNLQKEIGTDRVITSQDKGFRQKIGAYVAQMSQVYPEMISSMESSFQGNEQLVTHLYEVSRTLVLFGIEESMAMNLGFWHDIGKGIYMKAQQTKEAMKLFKGQGLDVPITVLRRLGEYRRFITPTLQLDELKSRVALVESEITRYQDLYEITDEELNNDRAISRKILKHYSLVVPGDVYWILERYFAGENTGNLYVALLRLADLVSPYVVAANNSEISLDFIKKAVTTRINAVNERYNSSKSSDDYLDETTLKYLKQVFPV